MFPDAFVFSPILLQHYKVLDIVLDLLARLVGKSTYMATYTEILSTISSLYPLANNYMHCVVYNNG